MKLSVVVPTLNSGKIALERMIKSFIEQDYSDKELVIIDGGSSDDSLEAIKEYEKSIAFWVSEPDGGPHHAFLKGLTKATGDYAAFLGGTDWLGKGALTAVADEWERTDADVLYGGINTMHQDGTVTEWYPTKIKLEGVYYADAIGTPGTFVRRPDMLRVWESAEELKYGDDSYLWAKLYREGKRFAYVDCGFCLATFSYGGVSTTNLYQSAIWERKGLIKAIEGSEDLRLRYLSEIERTYARRLYLLYQKLLGEKEYVNVMRKVLPSDREFILFGVGQFGEDCMVELERLHLKVSYCVDNDSDKWGKRFHNLEIKNPDRLREENGAAIIVTSFPYEEEMIKQLKQMNFSNDNCILSFRSFPKYLYDYLGEEIFNNTGNIDAIDIIG